MRVAVLSFHSFDYIKGGTELFTEHLRSAFPDLTLITYKDAARSSLPRLDRFNLQEPRMGLAIGRRFREMLKQEDFDLAICNSTAGWWLSVLPPDIPMLNVFHYTMKGLARETLGGTSGYLPSRYFLPLFERLTAYAKTDVAVSHKVHRELEAEYGIGSHVIENGVPLDRFSPIDKEQAREELGIEEDGPLALFVGRADHTKGFDIVQEVARRRPGLRILCVTSSNVEEKGLIVHRNVPNERMPLYYSAADLLLFPSRYESFGYAPLEAMACGLPVVASRTGIFEDLRDERVGKLVADGRAESFADAVDEVLRGKYEPRAAISERYSLERFAREYREVARVAVAEHGPETLKERNLNMARF
jgi:glycosyltransferase involved in cell wall biosynthesis